MLPRPNRSRQGFFSHSPPFIDWTGGFAGEPGLLLADGGEAGFGFGLGLLLLGGVPVVVGVLAAGAPPGPFLFLFLFFLLFLVPPAHLGTCLRALFHAALPARLNGPRFGP